MGVITIIHHSGYQMEAFISVVPFDVKAKTDKNCSRFHIVPDLLLLLSSLPFTAQSLLEKNIY